MSLLLILVVLLAAGCAGSADFVGGWMTRRLSVAAVGLWGQGVGLIVLTPVLPFFPAADLARVVLSGLAAGSFGSLGLALLYSGLATGRNALVAPVAATIAASLPVACSLAWEHGAAPTARVQAGLALGLGAVVLLGWPASVREGVDRRGLLLGAGAGAAFGAFTLSLGWAGERTGLWPLVIERATILALFGLAARRRGGFAWPRGPILGWILLGGALDMASNALLLAACQRGRLPIVLSLFSLYPVATVLLGRAIYQEPISGSGAAGLALAVGSVACLSAGAGS